MSRIAPFLKRRSVLAVAALLVIGALGIAWWQSGDDDVDPLATGTPSATPTPGDLPDQDEEEKEEDEEDLASADAECEGPDTKFNLEGERVETLLPDCGQAPVTAEQQAKKGLGLACGGKYPVILYKTTTSDMKSSICGTTSSGEDLRMVVQTADGEVRDVGGYYEYRIDGFVANKGGTKYTVLAYDGTIVVDGPSGQTKQDSTDWISLDNESDYEPE